MVHALNQLHQVRKGFFIYLFFLGGGNIRGEMESNQEYYEVEDKVDIDMWK